MSKHFGPAPIQSRQTKPGFDFFDLADFLNCATLQLFNDLFFGRVEGSVKIIVLAAVFVLIAVGTLEYDHSPTSAPLQQSLSLEALPAQLARMPWVGENEFNPEMKQMLPEAEEITARTVDTAGSNAVYIPAGD